MLSGLNLEQQLLLSGNREVQIVEYPNGVNKAQYLQYRNNRYAGIDIDVTEKEESDKVIDIHTAIKETYNDYIVHSILFDDIQQIFQEQANVRGFIRFFKGSMNVNNLKKIKFIKEQGSSIIEKLVDYTPEEVEG